MTEIKQEPAPCFQTLAKEIRQQFLGHDVPQCDRSEKSPLRVMLYSHDTMGVGHMRRNMLIASTIKNQFPDCSILTLAGATEACVFARSAGIDCLTLPSFQKRSDGTYTSRSLGVVAGEILSVRSETILAAIKSYKPDLLIVDKLPAGAGGELLPSLDWLSTHSSCHCVLGLRDILDTPDQVIQDWRNAQSFEVIRAHFQSVWIYGDQNVYDAVREYDFPADIAAKTQFTGYLKTCSRLKNVQPTGADAEAPFVLCTVGGGQDGEVLPLNFVEAMRASGHRSKLLMGPNMPDSIRKQIQTAACTVPSLEVIDFVDEGDLLVKHASHVVSMGGYNTLSAILSYQKPALIVPRVKPRMEQSVRADRLAELGYVQTIHPDDLSPSEIINWLDTPVDSRPAPSSSLDMCGLERVCEAIHADFPAVKYSEIGVGA